MYPSRWEVGFHDDDCGFSWIAAFPRESLVVLPHLHSTLMNGDGDELDLANALFISPCKLKNDDSHHTKKPEVVFRNGKCCLKLLLL